MTEPPAQPPAPPPGDPPPGAPPPPAGDPSDPPAPTRDDVIRDPQALLDVLGTTRDENRRMTRRLRDFERAERERADAGRTELEREQARANTAEQRIAALEGDLLRQQVAIEAFPDNPALGLQLAPRLTGTTRDELWSDAGRLRELVGAGARPGQRPPVDFGSGSRLQNGGSAPAGGTDAQMDALIRRKAGRA